ncbi:hypothetical protein CC80DRAFT_317495 [Byssothecium circinans]|uniref:Uncharacterized protein n=1 Tax=Byssothecium circinans TaxID=147558 RepID=A0A6A5T9E8_9PLEO|nr:hypothetical protein CC80DRAFT_317495 [Byssothecium circinans]
MGAVDLSNVQRVEIRDACARESSSNVTRYRRYIKVESKRSTARINMRRNGVLKRGIGPFWEILTDAWRSLTTQLCHVAIRSAMRWDSVSGGLLARVWPARTGHEMRIHGRVREAPFSPSGRYQPVACTFVSAERLPEWEENCSVGTGVVPRIGSE